MYSPMIRELVQNLTKFHLPNIAKPLKMANLSITSNAVRVFIAYQLPKPGLYHGVSNSAALTQKPLYPSRTPLHMLPKFV